MNDQAVTFVQVSANEAVIQPKVRRSTQGRETPEEENPPNPATIPPQEMCHKLLSL